MKSYSLNILNVYLDAEHLGKIAFLIFAVWFSPKHLYISSTSESVYLYTSLSFSLEILEILLELWVKIWEVS